MSFRRASPPSQRAKTSGNVRVNPLLQPHSRPTTERKPTVREKVKRKLHSRQGATLLLALLLFLICAATGSVAITAGTASSGTVSERAKMDQRYFSVTSAAELLRKKLDGLSVNVSVPVTENSANIDNGRITKNLQKLLKEQSLYLISALEDTPVNANIQATATGWTDAKYKITATISDNSDNYDKDVLEATVTISRIAVGTMDFTIESAIRKKNEHGVRTTELEDEKFHLKMEYAATPVPVDDGYTVTWNVKSIGLSH